MTTSPTSRADATGATERPWSVRHDGKTIMGNGGDNFVVYAFASVTCGREGDDYYSCRTARAEINLRIKPEDAALIVTAVNSYASLKERVAELEANERAYEAALGQRTYNEVAMHIKEIAAALKSASDQCGNVIYNCEQRPADNQRHLDSWKGVKQTIDSALSKDNEHG